MNCAVFASGGGSNFQALLDRRNAGQLHVDFNLMIGNNSNATAFERARKHDIPCRHLAPSHFDTPEQYTQQLLQTLREHKIEMIVLAGYMRMIPETVVKAYHHKIVNIHPALLPAFGGKGMYGKKVHQAVIDYGAKITGVTVHFVDEQYDHGPVILQETVRVEDTDTADTLADRVLAVEHASYWKAVEAIAQGAVRVEGRRVIGADVQ
ncbi:MAG: phosphoribosylglycinamide formyltransferase [Chitinivibrionales bacterium]